MVNMWDNIKEREDIIVSKLEYTKKRKYIEKDKSFIDRIDIINKVIENKELTIDEYNKFLSQLEYWFKKKLKESLEWDLDIRRFNWKEDQLNHIWDMHYGFMNNKTEKALWIILNLKVK